MAAAAGRVDYAMHAVCMYDMCSNHVADPTGASQHAHGYSLGYIYGPHRYFITPS